MNKLILLNLTSSSIKKIKSLIIKEKNPNLKLRVYVTGGGCSGFKYCFVLDDIFKKGDYILKKQGASLIIDSMSLQYLIGSSIDYKEGLNGSYFIVNNFNAKNKCGCGLSFNI